MMLEGRNVHPTRQSGHQSGLSPDACHTHPRRPSGNALAGGSTTSSGRVANGCIGMGQAPATDKISLRTVPRNFPGRSGTREDKVYLCSPETAAASAMTGMITDPRTLRLDYPRVHEFG